MPPTEETPQFIRYLVAFGVIVLFILFKVYLEGPITKSKFYRDMEKDKEREARRQRQCNRK